MKRRRPCLVCGFKALGCERLASVRATRCEFLGLTSTDLSMYRWNR